MQKVLKERHVWEEKSWIHYIFSPFYLLFYLKNNWQFGRVFSCNFTFLSDLQVFHMSWEKVSWQQTQALWQSFASSASSLPSCWWLLLSNAPNRQDPSLRGFKMCPWWVRRHNSVMRTCVSRLMLFVLKYLANNQLICYKGTWISWDFFVHLKTFNPVATRVTKVNVMQQSFHKCVCIR